MPRTTSRPRAVVLTFPPPRPLSVREQIAQIDPEKLEVYELIVYAETLTPQQQRLFVALANSVCGQTLSAEGRH